MVSLPGAGAVWGLDRGDRACVKNHESLSHPPTSTATLEKQLEWGEYSWKWQPPQDLRWGRMYTPVP